MRAVSFSNQPALHIHPRPRSTSRGYQGLEHLKVLEFTSLQMPGGAPITVRQFR